MRMEEAQAMVSDQHHKRNKMMKTNKGKRTKRKRPISSFNLTPNTSTSSSACGEDYANSSFTSASYESTEEDEDMANCLILLAQGGASSDLHITPNNTPNKQHTSTTLVSSPMIKGSFFEVFECKTCNRTFPSFQALGGHRASHKKPKTADHDKKPPTVTTHLANSTISVSSSMDQQKSDDLDSKQLVKKTSPPSIPPLAQPIIATHIKGFKINKAKMHECSICGSEFSSGQALGGHMRRHRAIVANNNNTSSTIDSNMRVIKQERGNILALDLNLPAPEDHDHHHYHYHYQQHQIHFQRDSNFQLLPTKQTSSLVFNAPAMVDCHY